MELLSRRIVLGAAALACTMSASHALYAESPADEPPRYCTVFTHFIKSGGSTLKRQMSQSCHRDKARLTGLITGDWRTTPASRLDVIHNSSVIVGPAEMVREPLKAIGRDCEYFTMLRHPIERIISAFYYCPQDHDVQDRPAKWCGDSTSEQASLQARLTDFAKRYWRNRTFAVMLTSILCDPNFEFCDPEHAREEKLRPHNVDTREGWLLHQEVKRILSTYTAVGIFEERELSMRLFNAKVKSPVRDWDATVAVNPGPSSAAREELLSWAYTDPELHGTLAADLLLYNYGLALFRQQTRVTLGVQWT